MEQANIHFQTKTNWLFIVSNQAFPRGSFHRRNNKHLKHNQLAIEAMLLHLYYPFMVKVETKSNAYSL